MGGASLSLGHFTTLPRGYMGSSNIVRQTLRRDNLPGESLIQDEWLKESHRPCDWTTDLPMSMDGARGSRFGVIVLAYV